MGLHGYYRYHSTGSFKPHTPKPDFKGCLVWAIVLIVFVLIVYGVSKYFGLS